ncbi:hypothetical protein SAMN04488482_4584 [Pseudomonas chlororaphis]|nr:hypothetical protein C4K27_3659 [Pseudomonas chlororaphis subsp. chlororaphis]SMQ09359.1 hypothetical protein SAMN04488482_4584 [Pseudomonas chlororaphis]
MRCLPDESFGLDRSLAALGSGYRAHVLSQAGRQAAVLLLI